MTSQITKLIASCRQCDRKRPYCGQCLLKGLECEGYVRETIFLNATAGKTKQYRVDRPPGDVIAPRGAFTGTLSRTAYEEHYLGTFWHVYLPQGREFPSCATPYTNGGWTTALPKLYGTSPVIRKMMLAVCLMLEGQTSGREREREEGLRYYTSSLQSVAGVLKNGERADHMTLVITARLFGLYEVSSSQSQPTAASLFHRPIHVWRQRFGSCCDHDRFFAAMTREICRHRQKTGGSTLTENRPSSRANPLKCTPRGTCISYGLMGGFIL